MTLCPFHAFPNFNQQALMMPFYVSMALGVVALAGACAVEWRSVKGKKIETSMIA